MLPLHYLTTELSRRGHPHDALHRRLQDGRLRVIKYQGLCGAQRIRPLDGWWEVIRDKHTTPLVRRRFRGSVAVHLIRFCVGEAGPLVSVARVMATRRCTRYAVLRLYTGCQRRDEEEESELSFGDASSASMSITSVASCSLKSINEGNSAKAWKTVPEARCRRHQVSQTVYRSAGCRGSARGCQR